MTRGKRIAMAPYTYFIYEEQNGVVFLTINRPPLNIFSLAAVQEFSQILDSLKSHQDISILVLSGAGGKSFSAGLEIKEHLPEKVGEILLNFHQIFHKLAALPQIIIAMIRGYCLGGGCELVSFCDMAVAEEEAIFGQPEIHVGCFPPVGAAILPELMGHKAASELVLTGRHIPAEEAKTLGLVNRVVPAHLLLENVEQIVNSLRQKSPVVLKLAKQALRGNQDEYFKKNLNRVEQIYLQHLIHTEDCREGIVAFLEKRRPQWTGK